VATVSAPSTKRRSDIINAARRQLGLLETAGPVGLFGAQAHRVTEGLTVQRLDVEDRLSAVLDGDAEPVLYDTWVDGLDSASRA
jgi:hypothetical protein